MTFNQICNRLDKDPSRKAARKLFRNDWHMVFNPESDSYDYINHETNQADYCQCLFRKDRLAKDWIII